MVEFFAKAREGYLPDVVESDADGQTPRNIITPDGQMALQAAASFFFFVFFVSSFYNATVQNTCIAYLRQSQQVMGERGGDDTGDKAS
jgi:hypothetical protein